MGVGDLVKITTYLVRPEDVAAAGAARAKHFGDARPGSATIIVKALVNPALLIEIEAVAAAASSHGRRLVSPLMLAGRRQEGVDLAPQGERAYDHG